MTDTFNFNKVQKELNKIDNLKKIAGHMDIDEHQYDENINFIHKKGYRQSIMFKKQQNYTFNELLIILNKLDNVWEENSSVALRYPYIQ